MVFKHPQGPTPRTAAILKALETDRSLKSIAQEFGVSYQRVQQIAYYWNVRRPRTRRSSSPAPAAGLGLPGQP